MHADQARAAQTRKRFSELSPDRQDRRRIGDRTRRLEAAKELAAEDSSFAEEVDRLGKRVSALETKLAELLAAP